MFQKHNGEAVLLAGVMLIIRSNINLTEGYITKTMIAGLDLARKVCSVRGIDEYGKVVLRHAVRRTSYQQK
ncbi:MAG: hypothetical protein ABL860_08890 [Candidatus Nitrotoga sp.]